MNAGSLFTRKKNIYTVKYGTRKDAGSFRGPVPEGTQVPHRCLHGQPTSPPGGLLPGLRRGPCSQGLALDALRPTSMSSKRKQPCGRRQSPTFQALLLAKETWLLCLQSPRRGALIWTHPRPAFPRGPHPKLGSGCGAISSDPSGAWLGLQLSSGPRSERWADHCSWPARPHADPESLGTACMLSDVPRTLCSLAAARRGHVPSAWTPRLPVGRLPPARTFLPAG